MTMTRKEQILPPPLMLFWEVVVVVVVVVVVRWCSRPERKDLPVPIHPYTHDILLRASKYP